MVKGALGWGARVGKGVMSCRDASGHWGPPIFLTVKGGSFGFQIGVEKADVVLFFMTDKSARSLMESKFTLGGKAGLAAGPVGRTAEASTDLKLDAEIYSYARSKGLFAGISLEGARVAPDEKATRRFYGPTADSKRILREHAAPANPPSARAFVEALP
jgi:lipid-binding SYLF domain-containing protein